ncbi:uncharacterized protein LOC141536738 [Cotesia typhae]|uniref:uncharacterized protein LOC141536738 n=1 Tax=Cotesia typhae TaxID=2053667 RepID=UPI003D69DE1A
MDNFSTIGNVDGPTYRGSEQKNLFKFNHSFSIFSRGSTLQKSPEFATPKIPDVKFKIIVEEDNGTKTMNFIIKKDDPRKSVSIITLKIGRATRTDRFVDWTKKVFFRNILLPFTSDACCKNHNYRCTQSADGYKNSVTVDCSIIWGGFVEDLYYPDVSTILKIFHKNEEFSDVVIKVDETEFKAHKNIIAAQSPVFYKMLTSDMKESNENSITFPDTDVDVIEELLLYFYKGKMDKAEKYAELALKLFEFAHMYEIERVKSICEYILITKMTKGNVFNILYKGQLYKSVILQQHAITFIEMNAAEIRDDAAFELPASLGCTESTSTTSKTLPESPQFDDALLPFDF